LVVRGFFWLTTINRHKKRPNFSALSLSTFFFCFIFIFLHRPNNNE
jgi:hypothetical protein